MNTEVQTQKKNSLIETMAGKFGMDSKIFFDTLKGTIMKPDKEGKQATNEEVAAFLIVANKYDLNPFTKEIYAYPDKRAGIVPIVSTDGWTKLMTTHQNYRTHTFRYSENQTTPKNGKPCPEWCEVDIEKADGSHVVIREYLDEVFRDLPYANSWQTHTKRMLRHKTKIQGAREAFGFSGIYDEDEADRIIDAVKVEKLPTEEPEMPRSIAQAQPTKEPEPPQVKAVVIGGPIIGESHKKQLKTLLKASGKSDEWLVDQCEAGDPDKMTVAEYAIVMEKLSRMIDEASK